MFHRKWIAEVVFLLVVDHDDVIYMHASASRLWALAAVYHSALLYEKKLDGLLCERDVASMYIYTSSVSRLLRGYYVLVVCCKLLEPLQNLSSCSSNEKTKPPNIVFIPFSYNISCHKGIGSCAALTQS